MKRYFIDISTAESGRVWQEVDIKETYHTSMRKEFGRNVLCYDGKRVYEGNLDDKYFRSIFTGEIHWLPIKKRKTKEQIAKQSQRLIAECQCRIWQKAVELNDYSTDNPYIREYYRRMERISDIAISLLEKYGYINKEANKHQKQTI